MYFDVIDGQGLIADTWTGTQTYQAMSNAGGGFSWRGTNNDIEALAYVLGNSIGYSVKALEKMVRHVTYRKRKGMITI